MGVMSPLTNYVHRSPKKILGSPLKFNFLLRSPPPQIFRSEIFTSPLKLGGLLPLISCETFLEFDNDRRLVFLYLSFRV